MCRTGRKWTPYGNSSEAPIVVAAGKVGLWGEDLEYSMPRVFEIPFSSSRKVCFLFLGTRDCFCLSPQLYLQMMVTVTATSPEAALKYKTKGNGSDCKGPDLSVAAGANSAITRRESVSSRTLFPAFFNGRANPGFLANVKGAVSFILP